MRVQRIGLTALAFATGLALAGCQREESDGPTELSGRMFVFNYRVSAATYMITLKKKAPIAEGTYAVAEFENPLGGDPIVLREKIFPFWDKITLESPDIHCVRKDKPYQVSVKLVDASGKTIQTIKTEVKSNLDQSILAAKPLVVGPVYTKNPEVFKADGTTDFFAGYGLSGGMRSGALFTRSPLIRLPPPSPRGGEGTSGDVRPMLDSED